MLISEIFYALQGEGELTGVPSVFIRTSGCNLRCTWCDTPYASWKPEGRHNPEALRQWIAAYTYQIKYVVASEADLNEVACHLESELGKIPRWKVHLLPHFAEQNFANSARRALYDALSALR